MLERLRKEQSTLCADLVKPDTELTIEQLNITLKGSSLLDSNTVESLKEILNECPFIDVNVSIQKIPVDFNTIFDSSYIVATMQSMAMELELPGVVQALNNTTPQQEQSLSALLEAWYLTNVGTFPLKKVKTVMRLTSVLSIIGELQLKAESVPICRN